MNNFTNYKQNKSNQKESKIDKEFNQLNWVKICKEFYKDHDPNKKFGSGGVAVTVLMSIEEFAEWLSDKGYLK